MDGSEAVTAANLGNALAAAVDRAQSGTANAALKGMDGDAFLQLFVAQMRYQNPMEPTGGEEMMQQTAIFTQVELMKNLAETQQQLMGFQQIALASSLVGKHVVAELDSGPVEGVVDGFRFTADGPVLQVGDVEVPIDRATSVSAAEEDPPGDPPPDDPPAVTT